MAYFVKCAQCITCLHNSLSVYLIVNVCVIMVACRPGLIKILMMYTDRVNVDNVMYWAYPCRIKR